MKVLISGGGTGGHIFPAISIANAIREIKPDTEFLFIGALGRMEMDKVPAEGYRIIGLPVRGFIRPLFHPGNIQVLIDLYKSIRQAKKIIRNFQPDVAVGVGGYASAAALKAAYALHVPYVLQEQNGFAGVTNQKLARHAEKICVAYPGMERFFPADRIVLTGNPVRQKLLECQATPQEARLSLGLEPDRKTLFITGGSLGARSVNKAIAAGIRQLQAAGIQVLWQTGSADGDKWEKEVALLQNELGDEPCLIHPTVFVSDMAMAYRAADIVISRSGAGGVNEVCLLGKAAIFVPLPTAAEDHQTANARVLSEADAAILCPDAEAPARLIKEAIALINDPERIARFEQNAKALGKFGAAETIAKIVIETAAARKSKK
ncbi:MAG: undecaprenyldiphospho-muramoylpentapeptide beta-N-acetylglucosaminyltransferase [Bacteroidales bacterium]|nr:undecaprenyldiphospho-muramoylpentapeptide beta-N-acetylglucosaminyltransferase [Bacteroidales bacterium]